MVVLFTIASSGIALLLLAPLLRLVGATDSNLPYAVDYMRIILAGMVFQMPSMVLAGLIRVEGRPKLSMTSQLIAGTVNIILDYLFVGVFGWGVPGAAYATLIGQAIGFAVMIWYFFLSGQSLLRLTWASLRPKLEIIRKICGVGASSFFGQISNSVSGALLNVALATYGGDAAMTAAGAMGSLSTLAIMPIFGLQQGLGPIIGYNYGMKRNDRIKSALVKGVAVSMVISTGIFAVLQLFPSFMASMFIDPASPTMQVCVRAMRINLIMMPLIPINFVGASYFQSTAQSMKAFLLGVSRAFLFLIPLIFILPKFFGLDGAWLAQPAADLCSISFTLVLLVMAFRNKERQTEEQSQAYSVKK
jgi:putative MATE family efflux protein